jgi:hypothetical protein
MSKHIKFDVQPISAPHLLNVESSHMLRGVTVPDIDLTMTDSPLSTILGKPKNLFINNIIGGKRKDDDDIMGSKSFSIHQRYYKEKTIPSRHSDSESEFSLDAILGMRGGCRKSDIQSSIYYKDKQTGGSTGDDKIDRELIKIVDEILKPNGYKRPEPNYGEKILEFATRDEYVDYSRELKSIVTDLISYEFLNSPDSNINFLKMVYNSFDFSLKKYIERSNITPEDNSILFLLKGGNVMRMRYENVGNLLPGKIFEELNIFYKRFFKKSDADFSIYINPDIKIDDVPAFDRVFTDMRHLSYLIQRYLKKEVFYKDMAKYFDFFKYNKDKQTKMLGKCFEEIKNAKCFKDSSNEVHYEAEPISLSFVNKINWSETGDFSYDEIKIVDEDMLAKYGSEIKDISVKDKEDVGKDKLSSLKYDLGITFHKNKPKTVVVYPISDKPHSIYISSNNALRFKKKHDSPEVTWFDLVRSKVNVQVVFGKVLEDGTKTTYAMGVGGELIDCSIPYKDSLGYSDYFKDVDKNKTLYGEGSEFPYYSYSPGALIHDLENILFDIEVPWEDPKYVKRLNRLLYLYTVELIAIDIDDKDERVQYIKKAHRHILDMNNLFGDISRLNQTDFNTKIDVILNKLQDYKIYSTGEFNKLEHFKKSDKKFHSYFDRIIDETDRISKRTKVKIDEFPKFKEYIDRIIDNFAVILKFIIKRGKYLFGDGLTLSPEDLDKVDPRTTLPMVGGMNGMYKKKYLRYKRKYLALKKKLGK